MNGPWTVALAAALLYSLIVAGTLAWVQLQGRLDRLELLTFPRRHKET